MSQRQGLKDVFLRMPIAGTDNIVTVAFRYVPTAAELRALKAVVEFMEQQITPSETIPPLAAPDSGHQESRPT